MSTPEEVDRLNQHTHVLLREKNTQAQNLAKEACALAVHIGYKPGYLNGLINHGRALSLQGDYQSAMPLFADALVLAEESQLPAVIAEALQEIARTHFTIGEYDEALQHWARCLDVAHTAQAQDIWLRALIGLGQIYNAHGDYLNALAHHRWALNSWREHNDPALYVAAAINVGVDLYQQQRLDEATEVLEQINSGNSEQQAEIHSILGLIHLAQGHLGAAERELQAALDINRQQNNMLGYTTNLLSLGRLAMIRQDGQDAHDKLHAALEKATQMGTPHLLFQIDLALAENHEARNEWQQALFHFKRYHSQQQQVLRQASPHRLQAMEMQLEVEKARMENTQLRRRHASEQQERRRVERMASEDTLTGLLNRRGMEQSALNLLALSEDPVSALMIDVDHFKKINDTWGHEIGDKVLRQVGALLKSGCRQGDLVARWGGEEFAILLQNRDGTQGAEVAERLRRLVKEWSWSRITPELDTTISVGVAQYQASDTLTSVIQRADERLYTAKRQGRNRVVH